MLPLAGLGAQLCTRDALLWGLAHKPHEYWPAQRRHHNPNLVFNLTNRNNQQKSLYIEYVKNSTGSRQHPCPAYDGCTHDSNNAYISACDEFMHVSVLCLAEACRRRGPAIFELGDGKEGQGGSQRLDSRGTEGQNYVGQDLPYGRFEEACQKRKRTVSKAGKPPPSAGSSHYRKKADDSGEDSKENSEEDSEAENSWEDTFEERYENAREELTQRLTLFMNDYLCQISGTSKEAVAVFWGLGAERECILKPINDVKHQGDDLKTELPPLLIKAKTKGRKETRGSVRPDRGLKTTFRRAWLQNTKRRVAKGIDFYTDPTEEAVHNKCYSECLTNKLNGFTGFRVSTQQVQKYMQTHWLDAAEMDRLASPFRDYVHDIIAGGMTQMYLYLLKWPYSLLRQGQKPEQACVFISEPGAGKCTLVFVSSKPDELTGKHNLHLGFKVLVVSEEAVHSTNKVGSNAMKEKITSKRLNINPKFMPWFSVRDPSGLLFNSNHDDTVLVERGDRRYIFFPVSNKFANRIRTTSAQETRGSIRSTSAGMRGTFLYHTVKNSNFLDEVEGPVHWTPKDWHKSYNIWCTLNRNGHFTAKNIVTFEKSLETYLRWDSQAKHLLAEVSQEEQVQHVRAQITGVYNARYS
eukprot:g63875.t1